MEIKKVLVLVDFSSTGQLALDQAIEFAQRKKAKVALGHVLTSGEEEQETKHKLEQLAESIDSAGLESDIILERGDFLDEIQHVVKRHKADLVVVGTHGKVGLRQNLFGSNIYNLVKSLPAPSLVVSDDFKRVQGGFKKILLPIAPHENFIKKVTLSAELLAPEGRLVLFSIVKPGLEFSDRLEKNMKETSQFLDDHDISWENVEAESQHFSIGFSRETIQYAADNGIDAISIMAKVSDENKSFGTMDKESIILNKKGLAVLCYNEG